MADISTTPGNRVKALATNSTDTSYAALNEVLLASKPGGAGVFNTSSRNLILIWPFGTDADGETFNMRAVGWWRGHLSYGYSVLADFGCTISAEVGVAAGDVINTDLFCDAITHTSGVSGYTLQPTTADTPALISVDTLGCHLVQFQFDRVLAATANAMVALI